MKILNVVGARPNFMKVAPLHRALEAREGFTSRIVHTGQHYDARMSDIFFRQLEMPEPHVYLGIGGGTHTEQTARIMLAFQDVLRDEQPDLVLVVGDVNSTLACSLVAAKELIPVAHVESGLRSGDMTMPEEVNRILTDRISDFLFVTEQSGLDNLKHEGVPDEKVFFVGNCMIDALVHFREKAASSTVLDELQLGAGGYILMTMHRPATVDNEEGLNSLVDLVTRLSNHLPVVMPLHPRTRNKLAEMELLAGFEAIPGLRLMEPQGYLEFLHLMERAAVVVTDSGGVQEETTFLQVPCITLRPSTERPITITMGTNELMDLDPARVETRVAELIASGTTGKIPPLWDGGAAERIVDIFERVLQPQPVSA